MGKYNKMEVVGLILMTIGGLLWLSEEYYIITQLESIYSGARFVFFSGLLIWALGLMAKEAGKRKQKKSDGPN